MSVYWGIRKKLLVITALTMLPLLAGSVWVTIRLVERSYTSQTKLMETATLGRVASRLDFLIHMAKSDTVFLAELPNLVTLARAVNSGGVDPQTGEPSSWAYRDSLRGLIAFMDAKQVYDQARLLDAKGREVLRVNLVDGRAEEVPRTDLQDKGKRYYFTEASRLPSGKVFVSDVDLNRERGQIEKPHKPVLRFAAPLRDGKGRLLGVVVLNFYANRMFADALGSLPQHTGGVWMILSQDGYYLYHSARPELLWGAPRDLDTGFRCQQEFGRTCEDFLEGLNTDVEWNGRQVNAYADAVDLQRSRDKWLAVIHLSPRAGFMAYVSQFGWVLSMVTVVALLMAVLLAWSSGRIVVSPLLELAETMKRFSRDDWSARSQVHSNDELGALASGFNEMAARLGSLYADLESKVAARTSELEQSNRRLVQSETRIRAILDNTVDAIITIDAKGVVQSFNKGAENIFGYTAEEVVGQKVNMLQPPEVAEQHDEYLQRYLDTGVAHIIGRRREERGRRKDGSLFPMSLAVSEVDLGDTRLFTGIISDITALRAAEDSLRESRQIYKSLAEAAPVGIFYADLAGKCTYVNEQWSRISGLSEAQALGEGWSQAIHPDDREMVGQKWAQTAGQGKPFEAEYRFLRPDGKETWVYGRAVASQDADGKAAGFVGTITDITGRKEIERAQAESMLLFQSTFEQAAVGIAHVAPDGTWLRVNNKLCSIVGYTREELLGDAFQSITHPDDLAEDLRMVQKVLDGEIDTYSLEKRYIKKDKSIVWINLTVSLVRDQNGDPEYFISVVEDIDRRKRTEEDNLRLGQVLEESLNEIFIFDAQTLKFLQVNNGGRRNLGYDMSELSRMTPLDIKPEFTREKFEELIKPLRAGEQSRLEFNTVHRRKDGTIYPVEINLQLSSQQINQVFVAIIQDITERNKAEAAIRESEQRYRTLVSNVPGAVYRCENDEKWTMRFVSDPIESITGYPAEDFIDNKRRAYADVIHPEDRGMVSAEVIKALNQGRAFELDYRIVRKDGEVRWVYEKGAPVSDEDGTQWLDGAILDITLRKMAEEESARMGQVLEDSLNEILIFDAHTLKFLQVNRGARQKMGYTMEEMSQMTALDVKPEFTRESFEELVRPLREGTTDRIVFTTVHRRKDGSTYPVESNLQLSFQQIRQVFVAIVQDISEKLKAQAEIERLSLVAQRTDNAVMITDGQGRIQWVNDAFTRISEFTFEEVMDKKPGDILHGPDTDPATVEFMRQSLAKGEGYNVEVVNYSKSGRKYWLSLDVQPVRTEQGEITNFVAVESDITERKAAEEAVRRAKEAAEEANRIKSEFLANMSHELRTPLNAIIGFSEILLDQTFGELNQKQARQTKHILDSGRHLLSLINDILDLSKVESGKMELELSLINLNEWLDSTMVLIKEKTTKHGISLSLECPQEVRELNFQGDERKLKQIMFNLLSNAAKFTPDGGSITIEAAKEEGHIRVSVIDTGVGIAEKDQKRIFDEFEQVDSTYSRTQQGTGLGLALTRKLVDLHGGKVWVESQGEGQGSTFSFTIPLRTPASAQDEAASAAADEVREALGEDGDGGERVLIIDDDPMARELLEGYLREGGFHVLSAADGARGLELARKLRPAAITLDIMLPDINGFEVLRQLRDDQRTSTIPVIIVSISDDREKGIRLGAAEFLQKPVDKRRLLNSLIGITPCAGDGFGKVLVIDDDPADVELVTDILSGLGCEIIAAAGGAEGIEIALREKPDLIVLDLHMPEVSGWDVLEALRDQGGDWHPPIMIFTGVSLSPAERQNLAGRVQAVVLKGGGKAELLREIGRLTKMAFKRS